MSKSFDVFLCHNSRNKPAVRELAEVLRARGLNVWLDEWELVPGRLWQEALEEIIATTRSAAVLVGKDGLGPWQNNESSSLGETGWTGRLLETLRGLTIRATLIPALQA